MSYPAEFLRWLKTPSRRVLLAEVGVRVGGIETTRYLSDLSYTPVAADDPIYSARITGGFSFSQSLDLGGGSGNLSWGEIDLDNADGALDGWLRDVWAMRPIQLYMGDARWPRADFVQVFSGTVEDIAVRDRTRLSLKLRDVLAPLNAPIATATLGGTGDNKDALLPLALGEIYNCTPLLTSATGAQVYQVHRGAIERIIEVRDNGYPVAATPDLAAGKLTLSSQRYGEINCDVQGAKIGGEYRNDVGGLVEWIACALGDGDKLASAALDAAALAAFRTAHPQPVGLWLPDRANRLDAMQQLAASVGATVSASALGQVRLVPLAFGAQVGTITPANMVDGTFAPAGRPGVRGAVQLSGCRNWTPQAAASIAASLAAACAPLLGDEWISVTARNAAVLADYRQPDTPAAVDTLLVSETDLQAEAERRLALWSVPRTIYRFTGFAEMLALELGQTHTLQHPRFGLAGGVPALVIGLNTDYIAGRVVVEVLV